MWGSILTEANTLTNFNFGFSTYKSDVLLHLSQWQYWWWFWFSFFWTLYFFIIIRLVNKRTMTFNPILNTSIRGHGKWGDFLVALIPLSWCGNILVNSNFILRMIEWQNESSLFTIRVQGKQWYWVYKFDAGAAHTILSAPKNIGHNRWFVLTPQEAYCADSYYQILHLGTQLEFKGLYHKYLSDDGLNQRTLNLDTKQTSNEVDTWKKASKNFWPYLDHRTELYTTKFYPRTFVKTRFGRPISELKPFHTFGVSQFKHYSLNYLLFTVFRSNTFFSTKLRHSTAFYDFEQIDDLSNFAANIAQHSASTPLKICRGVLNKHNTELMSLNGIKSVQYQDLEWTRPFREYTVNLVRKLLSQDPIKKPRLSHKTMMRLLNASEELKNPAFSAFHARREEYLAMLEARAEDVVRSVSTAKIHQTIRYFLYTVGDVFFQQEDTNRLTKLILFNVLFQDNNMLVEKVEDSELFWGYRQKKYKRFKKYLLNRGHYFDSKTLEPVAIAHPRARMFKGGIVQHFSRPDDELNADYHKAIKYNRHRAELVPVNLARRLLRTKRTLVLPAHVNITLISNSYDVVHSWFIPGLGLKIDCVPGRSTHHSFYVDNVGFYYGQCAEICGRYHHHMPIRLCALTFEHFLVWWQKKGLRRLHRFSMLTDIEKKKDPFLNPHNGALIK